VTIEELKKHIQTASKDATIEFKRLFHGRGGLYEPWKHVTIDSIGNILSVALYFQEKNESELLEMLKEFLRENPKYDTLVVQKRYEKGTVSEVLIGEVPEDLYIVENGMKLYQTKLKTKHLNKR